MIENKDENITRDMKQALSFLKYAKLIREERVDTQLDCCSLGSCPSTVDD
jgi:hypothetical protein